MNSIHNLLLCLSLFIAWISVMTAEIAVYNKTAVALAADSAVTISGGNMYKINNGAEKLFSLSKHHPVGIMVYGAGDLCGVPWEIIIKAYRKELGDKSFDNIIEYSSDFFEFLCRSPHIISDEMRKEHLELSFYSVFLSLMEHIKKDVVQPILKKNGSVDGVDTCEFIKLSCKKCLEHFDDSEFFSSFDESVVVEAIDCATPCADKLFTDHLAADDTEKFRSEIVDLLSKVFAFSICKISPFGRNTGIVIAGYGDSQYFPSILAFDVYGFLGDRIILHHNEGKSSYNGESGVTAYAQEEEVNAFMQGISFELEAHIKGNIDSISDVATQKIQDKILSKISLPDDENALLLEGIRNTLDGCAQGCIYNIDRVIHENYISKVVEMIEFLPKSDLGYMAESLVNLTAFKRKVSNDSETVGGPIDVAIISKGDGFVWIKRKHYFDKDLNHDYFCRR